MIFFNVTRDQLAKVENGIAYVDSLTGEIKEVRTRENLYFPKPKTGVTVLKDSVLLKEA